ncbi:MAG TPA: hypothetical protein VMX13_05065 [Sedimentisphaerales bacterium]|nr:hypothetical protein [Sedimentisphaerales bacterium]
MVDEGFGRSPWGPVADGFAIEFGDGDDVFCGDGDEGLVCGGQALGRWSPVG